MTIDIKSEPRNRSWIIFDIESAVTDESGHRRYQQMERYVPRDDDDDQLGRRGYKRAEDPLKTPRWIFQSITTASAMVLTEHPDGNADVTRFVTLSAPDHTEKEIVAGLLDVLADAPADADLVSWAGSGCEMFWRRRLRGLPAACRREWDGNFPILTVPSFRGFRAPFSFGKEGSKNRRKRRFFCA
ncbi:hypothetical protein [Sphingobium yanoikuyae]|uniref:hypothetical protein n=1 Tax=Sphingobium yanoikuyae TaxID=13690 RepID=UPI0026EB0BCE|nr:hypothetical protein [Sphingobium yanoikuyae]